MLDRLIPPEVRAVMFDAVGTLIYPHPPVAAAYHQAGKRYGSGYSQAEVAARFSAALQRQRQADIAAISPESTESLERPPTNQQIEVARWRQIVAEVFDDVVDRQEVLFQSLWDHFARPSNWRLYDDVADTWQGLLRLNLVVGVASNFDDRLSSICRQLEPLSSCQHVFWSAQIGFAKPSPRFFQAVETALRLSPDQILLVGDDPVNDHRGAQAALWRSILLDRSAGTCESGAIGSLRQLTCC